MTTTDHLQFDKSWADSLLPEFDKDYMKSLKDFLHKEKDKGKVICSHHPSPLSAYRGFLGSRPFSKINHFLKQQGQSEISWAV